jgi:pimeloyl-ACP methyl ester carboxylesterase
MEEQTILSLHGFASSSRSTKALYLRQKFAGVPHVDFHALDFNPTSRDFQYMTTTPVTLIHGRRDITVPIDHSRRYAAGYPDQVCLVEVDADHDLNDHLELVWRYVESFLFGT